jgi:hypothetical protein
VGDLGPPVRLEVGEQFEPAGVIGAVVRPAQRHHAAGVIAATLRPRCEVRGREALGLEAHDAGAADDLLARPGRSNGSGCPHVAPADRVPGPPSVSGRCRGGYRYQARGPDVLRERCVAGFAVAFTTRAGTTSPMRAGATRKVDPNQTRSLEAAVSRLTWTSAEATSGGDAALGAPGLPLGGQSARSTLVSHGGPIALIVTHERGRRWPDRTRTAWPAPRGLRL